MLCLGCEKTCRPERAATRYQHEGSVGHEKAYFLGRLSARGMGHFDGTGQKVVGAKRERFSVRPPSHPSFPSASSTTAPRFATCCQITPIVVGWSIMGLWVDDGAWKEGLND